MGWKGKPAIPSVWRALRRVRPRVDLMQIPLLGLFVALLWLGWAPGAAAAEDAVWEKYHAAGRAALERRDFPTAKKQFAAALRQARREGPETARVATSLFSQAELLGAQGKYAETEPLLRRILAIREKVLPPDHPDLANPKFSM